jgi:hypothetical protein
VASPQKENGFLQVATELLCPLLDLTATLGRLQRRILAAVLAAQYGAKKPDAYRMEFASMSKESGDAKDQLVRAASSLVRRNVLIKVDRGLYRFNKDYETWILGADGTQEATALEARNGGTKEATGAVAPRKPSIGGTQEATATYIESEIKRDNTPPNPPTGGMVGGGGEVSQAQESIPQISPHVVRLAADAARLNIAFDYAVRTQTDTEFGFPYPIMREAIRLAASSGRSGLSWAYIVGICRRLVAEGFQGQPEPFNAKPVTDAEREATRQLSKAREAELREQSRKSNEAAERANPEIRAVWAEMADRARERLAGGARPRRSMAAQPRVIRPPIERVELPTDDEIEARRATQLRALEEFRQRSATG